MLEEAIADRGRASGRIPPPSASRLAAMPRAVALASLAILAMLLVLAGRAPMALTSFYTRTQDQPLLLAAVCLLALSLVTIPTGINRLALSGRGVLLAACSLAVLAYGGRYWLLSGYDLTRDEQMAAFDSAILASGHLVAALPAAWQADVDALNTLFMMPASQPVAWVSSYLPMNAALRALAGLLGDTAFAGPLLTGLSAIFLWRVARLLWPEDREPAVVALAMLALSGQVLITGMTAYAMPAHLCFNLLWLWLFLTDRRRADVGALAAGFVATGLHQPLFHPLFVAPWLLLLLIDRRWPRLAFYVIGYALISAFWFAWPMWKQALVSGPLSATAAVGPDYVSRIRDLLASNTAALPLMAGNLLRFLAWQPILLLPLACAGLLAAKHDRRAAALAAGIALTVLAMTLLLPYQGHGFGYRYLHGLIGSTALLAGYGWRHLSPRREHLHPIVVRATLATALVLLPLQATMAHRCYAPYATANARIAATHADYVVIGGQDAPFAGDLVINRPDLSNRPLRLLGDMIRDPAALAVRICRPDVIVALPSDAFFANIDGYFGTAPSGKADARRRELAPLLERAGCRVSALE